LEEQSFDAYKPEKIAELVESIGVKKAVLPAIPTIMLGLMAGAFIAFGAMFFTLVMTNHNMGLGPCSLTRWCSIFIGVNTGGCGWSRTFHR